MKIKKNILSTISKNLWNMVWTIEFWRTIISTTIGVLLAFYLNGYRQENHLNNVTAQKLHRVFLESEFNGTVAYEIFGECSKNNQNLIFLKRSDVSIAMSTVEDENVVDFLPAYKLSFLISYIDAQRTLNQSLATYNDYFFKEMSNLQIKELILANLKSNAVSALTMCITLQSELKLYFDKENYDKDKILALEKVIKKTKQDIITGQKVIKVDK